MPDAVLGSLQTFASFLLVVPLLRDALHDDDGRMVVDLAQVEAQGKAQWL
jgi:hypothetical protein